MSYTITTSDVGYEAWRRLEGGKMGMERRDSQEGRRTYVGNFSKRESCTTGPVHQYISNPIQKGAKRWECQRYALPILPRAGLGTKYLSTNIKTLVSHSLE